MLYHEITRKMRAENPFISNTNLAYDLLLESIISGDFRPGMRILQNDLAKQFAMSRTPVRDAMLRLEKDGFIKSCERQGFIVTPAHYSDFVELFEFRCFLEERATSLAVRNFEDDDLQAMAENLRETQLVVDADARADRTEKILELDFAFHNMILQSSDNRYLIEAYERCKPKLYFYQRMVRRTRYNISSVVSVHEQIYQAILHRNAELAIECMTEHCTFYRRKAIQKIFESGA